MGGNLGTAVTRTITVVGSVVVPSGAGPGGGGGSAYAGVAPSGIVLNSAPEFDSPADDLVPYIVRILRTASRESRIAMNSASTLELKNPITEYICTDLNKYISQNDAYLSNIHEDEYTDAIKALMMYRPYDNEDQITDFSQRYLANKPFGITKYNEFYNGKQDITRAEFVKMLVRALSCHYVSSNIESIYTDVGENAWYTEYINFATENGWIDGYEDGTFRPHEPITRADAIRAIALAIQLDVPDDISDTKFVDVSSTNEYAPYVYAMNDLGVISPQNDYIFGLNGHISRNDIAKIFHTIFLNVDE